VINKNIHILSNKKEEEIFNKLVKIKIYDSS